MADVAERGTEGADAGRVGAAQLGPVQVLAVEEEGLPEVLGRAQVAAPGGDRVPGLAGLLGPAGQALGKPDQARYQLSRSPGVTCSAMARHSPTLAMPESALPTLRCSCPSN